MRISKENNSVKIVTWNINSINAHLEQFQRYLDKDDPDIVLLQEIKCIEENFPYFHQLEHYNLIVSGQKGYNGVAILSKYPLEDTVKTFSENPCDDQARFIETHVSIPSICNKNLSHYLKIICVYVPNGSEVGSEKFELKLQFLQKLKEYLSFIPKDTFVLIGGDFNIAPFDIDVYSPEDMRGKICFSSQEQKLMREILNLGFEDTYRLIKYHSKQFSWWHYKGKFYDLDLGLRIDFLLANQKLSSKLVAADIYKSTREQKSSTDHACVMAEFAMD